MNSAELSGELPQQFHPGDAPPTLHSIFQRVAARFPDSVAVTDGLTRLTYRELDARAERLARRLREHGVGRDRRTGLCVERSTELVVGILGILKAGGGYVPVDPDYPAERRAYILDSCDTTVVVTSPTTSGLVTSRTVVELDGRLEEEQADAAKPAAGADPAEAADDTSLAYVIFTSGSSGRPKGVLVEHRNAVRLFTTTHPGFGFDETDVWCNFHSTSFDFSVWEIWGALLYGGRLVMVDKETARDPRAFLDLLRRERVTVLNQTPSAFRNLMNAEAESGSSAPADGEQPLALRHVVFGGERLDPGTLAPWVERHGLDRPALVNMYGITETTVHVTWKRLSAADLAAEGPSPIGAPLPDLKVRITDPEGRPLPAGEEGLIQVAGPGLARGYLGDPELTRERFPYRTDDTGTEERWYDSGDLGVRTGPDEFAYVGRADRQLKVRGYRIEPGEIESRIKEHPAVRDCVVTAADFGEGDPRLVAYLVPAAADAEERQLADALREHVLAALPGHMTPSAYVAIDSVPLTVNGKLDQRALDGLLADRRASRTAPDAPAGGPDTSGGPAAPVEEQLRAIWTKLLDTADFGVGDDFFDLGGTSFSLVQMVNQVNARFSVRLSLGVLSRGATITALAQAVRNVTEEKQDD